VFCLSVDVQCCFGLPESQIFNFTKIGVRMFYCVLQQLNTGFVQILQLIEKTMLEYTKLRIYVTDTISTIRN